MADVNVVVTVGPQPELVWRTKAMHSRLQVMEAERTLDRRSFRALHWRKSFRKTDCTEVSHA
jgi:hypothetical protein